MQKQSIEFQKQRGYNIEYINNNEHKLYVKVYNGCKLHGDITIPWTLFNSRTKIERQPYTILCPICNPIKKQETTIETLIKNIIDKYNINYI